MKHKAFQGSLALWLILPGLLFGSVRQVGQNPDGLELVFETPPYRLSTTADGFIAIDLDGFERCGQPGGPSLPQRVYHVAIPPNVPVDGLWLEVLDLRLETLPGPLALVPAVADSPGRPGSGTGGEGPASVLASAGDCSDPGAYLRLVQPGQMRKWRFARLQFSPFCPNAADGTVTLVRRMTVRLHFADAPAVLPDEALLADAVRDDAARALLANYDEAVAWYRPRAEAPPRSAAFDYVIITTNAIVANSTALADFIAHKENLLHRVKVVTETDYGPLTGQAPNGTAEKIRQWLLGHYVADGIEYVLLIGNPDPADPAVGGDPVGDVPMKMCWPRRGSGSDENSPTDAFFADLTGNWDLDGDGYFGEWTGDYSGVTGGVDFANEVEVGRIPVYNADYATLDGILRKVIAHDNETDISWRSAALLPMSYSQAGYDGAELAEQMKDDYLAGAGFSVWRQYEKGNVVCGDNSAYACEEELRGGDVVKNRWAANDYGLVLWWGHGSETGAYVGYDGCWDGELFTSAKAPSLDNGHPAFVYQCSCTNGYPEHTNNLQYALLKNGGAGTVSASRVSWFNAGVHYGSFDGSTTNSGLGYEYALRLVQGLPAGAALTAAKSSMVPGSNTRLMNYYDFNLYGDPSTMLAGRPDRYGDLDRSSKAAAPDLAILENYLALNLAAGTPPFTAPLAAADLDRSGAVGAVDLLILGEYLSGTLGSLPQ